MPSFVPKRFNHFEFDDDEWDTAYWAELLDNSDRYSRLIRTVGYDCMRGVLRARVQEVDTRTPHSHYL